MENYAKEHNLSALYKNNTHKQLDRKTDNFDLMWPLIRVGKLTSVGARLKGELPFGQMLENQMRTISLMHGHGQHSFGAHTVAHAVIGIPCSSSHHRL